MKKIIDKAVEGGFSFKSIDDDMLDEYKLLDDTGGFVTIESGSVTVAFSSEEIIFSHNFLKAFFGEYQLCEDCLKEPETESYNSEACQCEQSYSNPAWIVHAQQLVLSEDRIKYLEKFI